MAEYFHHVTLIYGLTGQEVAFYPASAEVVRDGAPTAAASYFVRSGPKSNDDAAEFSGTATLDATSTTVDAASGYSQANRNKLNLTATTNIVVGRRYLVTNAYGQREVVIPTAIASADYIEVEEPLAYDYAASDTFRGLRQSFTVDATFIADSSKINVAGSRGGILDAGDTGTAYPPYRVEWRYATAGTLPWRSWTSFDVARQQARLNLDIKDLRGMAPDAHLMEWIGQRGQDFEPQLVLAATDLRIEARAAGYDPDAIRDPEIYNHIGLHRWWVRVLMAQQSTGADVGAALELAMASYTRLFEKTIGTALRAWVDTGSTGAATVAPAAQMWLSPR